MPIVTVNLPNGQQAQVNAPEGATDEQILRFTKQQFEAGGFDQAPQEPAQQEGIDFGGIARRAAAGLIPTPLAIGAELAADPRGTLGKAEAIGAIGSGIIAEPVAGLAGLAAAPIPGARAGDVVESAREALTFQPRTEAGQQALQTTGQAVDAAISTPVAGLAGIGAAVTPGGRTGAEAVEEFRAGALEKLTAAAADPVADALGPTAGAVVKTIPTAAGLLTGAKPLAQASRQASKLKGLEAAKKIIDDPTSAKNVEFMVRGGKRVSDKAAKEAIRQGFNAPTVAFAKGSAKPDRAKFLKMLNVKRKGLDDLNFARSNRASDVVGDSLAQRIKHIKRVNQSAGQRIDQVAKGLKGERVDISGAKKGFIDSLDSDGVSVSLDADTGRNVASFAGSSFEDIPAAQKAIQSMINRLDRLGDSADALQAHRAKRFIDESISLGGQSGQGLTGRAQRSILELRKGIDDTLDSQFKDYARVNEAYSDTIGALNAFQDAAGSKVNLLGENAPKAIGTASRRLLSNAQSRVNMIDAITDIERVAEKTGAKFADDIASQAQFADILDGAFGTSAQTSLAGEVGKVSGGQVVRGVAEPVSAALEAGAGKIANLRGVNQGAAFRSLESILAR